MAKRKKPISNIRPADEKSPNALVDRTTILVAIAAVIAFTSISLQPISSDLAWWQLSCGRQAIATASLWPSIDLLIDESQGESTAVGATISTAMYLLFGASGWMMVRVAVVVAVSALTVFYSRRRTGDESTANRNLALKLACLSISLAALSPYLDPVPILFDVIATAFVAVWILLPGDGRQLSNRIDFLSLAILFLFWANFGNHSFIGITMIVMASLSTMREISVRYLLRGTRPLGASHKRYRTLISRQRFAIGTAVAMFVAIINPIGWRVWGRFVFANDPMDGRAAVDACRHRMGRVDTGYLGPEPLGFPTVNACNRCLVAVGFAAVRPLSDYDRSAIFAWTSAVNMPLAIVWMTVQLLASSGHWSAWRSTSQSPSQTFVSIAVMVIVSAIMIRTADWGFATDLDPRMLQIAIADSPDTGTILTDDSRSTGMVAWVLGPVKKADPDGAAAARLHDEPGRALVGGRLIEHRRLFSDLRDSQQMSYWRDDESQGGWWLPLTQRGTSLLACSRARFKVDSAFGTDDLETAIARLVGVALRPGGRPDSYAANRGIAWAA
jgi:hypothetical protein